MLKNLFTNATICAAVTFLVAGLWVVIPFISFLIIWGILGIFTLFFGTIGWLTAIIGYITIILFILPFAFALIAGIIGFVYANLTSK